MKKIVIVCNRPWFYQCSIQNLQRKGITIESIVIYLKGIHPIWRSIKKNVINFERETGIPIESVEDQINFLKIMDRLYSDPNILFLMDYNLMFDISSNFYERLNIKYAIAHKDDQRIYFFTSGGKDIIDKLSAEFPGHVINPFYGSGQLFFDESQILSIVENEDSVQKDSFSSDCIIEIKRIMQLAENIQTLKTFLNEFHEPSMKGLVSYNAGKKTPAVLSVSYDSELYGIINDYLERHLSELEKQLENKGRGCF